MCTALTWDCSVEYAHCVGDVGQCRAGGGERWPSMPAYRRKRPIRRTRPAFGATTCSDLGCHPVRLHVPHSAPEGSATQTTCVLKGRHRCGRVYTRTSRVVLQRHGGRGSTFFSRARRLWRGASWGCVRRRLRPEDSTQASCNGGRSWVCEVATAVSIS